MKSNLIKLLSIILIISFVMVAVSCSKQETYTVTYTKDEGGYVVGRKEQKVKAGKDSEEVVAIAKDDYEFVGWSDGVETARRQELSVNEDISVHAYFRKTSNTYSFQSWKGGVYFDDVTFSRENFKPIKFPVLEKEHFTFKGWYLGDTQVADENGAMLIGEEILDIPETEIKAKWVANETYTYKLLIVYVTEIDATLETIDKQSTIKVNYKMSDLEREFCKLTTSKLKRYLDDMMDGLVNFEIDEYFTTQPVTTEDFFILNTERGKYNYLKPDTIPEVMEMSKVYDSALSVVNRNDYEGILYRGGGTAHSKYGEIYFDSFLYTINFYKSSLEECVDLLKKDKDIDVSGGIGMTFLIELYWLNRFQHELAHTIELRLHAYDYHDAAVSELHGNRHLSPMDANKMYFLNEAEINGEIVGIPYDSWKGGTAAVAYLHDLGDKIIGGPEQFYIGGYSISGQIRFDGYKFVRWTDGVTTEMRKDYVSGDATYTAIYEKIE